MLTPWKESFDQPRQCIKKQRYYFADKGPDSQSYGFSSSHVLMWELDHKEGWVPKNWCFPTVMLKKTLESPLDSKEIKAVNPKGDQPWIWFLMSVMINIGTHFWGSLWTATLESPTTSLVKIDLHWEDKSHCPWSCTHSTPTWPFGAPATWEYHCHCACVSQGCSQDHRPEACGASLGKHISMSGSPDPLGFVLGNMYF